MSFLHNYSRIDKVIQLWPMMPTYPGFTQRNKVYSQVTQRSGKKLNALRHVIVSMFSATVQNTSPMPRIASTEAQLRVKNTVSFHLVAEYQCDTEATIVYMETSMEEFHNENDVVSRFRASKHTKMLWEA
jgi:hypothetical protein